MSDYATARGRKRHPGVIASADVSPSVFGNRIGGDLSPLPTGGLLRPVRPEVGPGTAEKSAARDVLTPLRSANPVADARGVDLGRSGVVRRLRIKGSAWRTGLKQTDHVAYDNLVSTGTKENEATGSMVQSYKSVTGDLSVPELTQLKSILERGAPHLIEPRDIAAIGEEISRRSNPVWIAEQQRLAQERGVRQTAREQRLMTQGMTKLGGAGETWQERSAQITAWVKRMKQAEAGETWQTAFTANRMTARQIGNKSTNMGGKFTVRNKFEPENRARDREVNLDRGASGITARTVPGNFFDPSTGRRAKNEKGLHDLSASLLVMDAKKTILSQLKPYKDSIVVFMPAPTEDDMQIFNAVANLKDPDLGEYRKLKSAMTRIKLAQGSDMHTTLYDTSERSTDLARIRYGVTGRTQRSKDEDETVADETDIAARKSNALEYSSILGAGAIQTVNEIVMAYRAHESKLFPMFARWVPDKKHFRVLDQKYADTKFYIGNDGSWNQG